MVFLNFIIIIRIAVINLLLPFIELNFTQIVELLHVPLQSLYTYKTRLEQKLQQHHAISLPTSDDNNYNCDSLPKTMPLENGHNKKEA